MSASGAAGIGSSEHDSIRLSRLSWDWNLHTYARLSSSVKLENFFLPNVQQKDAFHVFDPESLTSPKCFQGLHSARQDPNSTCSATVGSP